MKKINIIELNFFIARYSFIRPPPPASPPPRRTYFVGVFRRGRGGEDILTWLKKIILDFRFPRI